MNKKIFVSIASYNDPLLFFTLVELITKATNPENITVGIVDQSTQDRRSTINKLYFSKQIRYVYCNILDTLGVCWARNIVFSLYDNEHYLLQIDSHMCFDKGWDRILIDKHNELLQISDKPILTHYADNFFYNNGFISCKKRSKNNIIVTLPRPTQILKEDNITLFYYAYHYESDTSIEGGHISGNFIFCNGNFINDVPYDPFLYFHGEEQNLAVRAYTRGWNIYHPNCAPLYHHYKTVDPALDRFHWQADLSGKRFFELDHLQRRSNERLLQLIYTDDLVNSGYGLGKIRTLDDYAKVSGIDYINRTITNVYKEKYKQII